MHMAHIPFGTTDWSAIVRVKKLHKQAKRSGAPSNLAMYGCVWWSTHRAMCLTTGV